MKLISKNQIKNTGFTLIEVLVVLGVLVLLVGAGVTSLVMLRGKIKKVAFEEIKENVMLAIEKARNRAATGFGSHGHGVCIKDGNLIVYEENCNSSYASNTNVLSASVFDISLSTSSINFERISASTSAGEFININNKVKICISNIMEIPYGQPCP